MGRSFTVGNRRIAGVFEDAPAQGAESRTLFVFAHGWTRGPDDFQSIRALTRELHPEADQFAAQLPTGLLSIWSADKVVDRLLADIDAIAAVRDYADIVLVGHSAAAMIMRAVWLRAMGAAPDAEAEPASPKPWATKVSRIVLLAALNRGWSPNLAMSPSARFLMWIGLTIDLLVHSLQNGLLGTNGYIMDLRRGSPFITTVRLQWIAMSRQMETAGRRMPAVAQLLGTIDDVVSPADNVDLETGATFDYIVSPQSDHFNVLDLEDEAFGPGRRKAMVAALTSRPDPDVGRLSYHDMVDFYSDGLDDFDLSAQAPLAERSRVKRVVFVVHGIRDYGFWTKKLAGLVKQLARDQRECRTVTSSYGYFPMGPFVLKALRRRRAEWLMDQYVRARSLYPEAKFSFMGHSNGTYLLGHALELCPAIRFEQVVLAGSVLPSRYDWKARLSVSQVKQILNYVATDDWVVALFPRFLGRLPISDLGGAGYDGFNGLEGEPNSYQVRYLQGGHGAAVAEGVWDHAARFLLDGKPLPPPLEAKPRPRRTLMSSIVWGLLSFLALPLAVLVIVGGGAAILFLPQVIELFRDNWWGGPPLRDWWSKVQAFGAAIIALLFLAYVFLVSRVLTRL